MNYYLRIYVGRGTQLISVRRFREAGDDNVAAVAEGMGLSDDDLVPVVDNVDEGRVLAIWMKELPQEIEEEPEVQRMLDQKGMRWCECFSMMAPTGEKGWVSVNSGDPAIRQITEQQFNEARDRKWLLPTEGSKDGESEEPAGKME